MSESKISKKICLVGDFGVGKTSLVRRFVDREFSDAYLTTVGVKISRKLVTLKTQSVQLLIWDLEGSSKFKSISSTHIQGASGAVIVADFSRGSTLEQIESHITTFLDINPTGKIIVALNKADLVVEEVVNRTQSAIAKALACNYEREILGIYATSAKTDVYVDRIFMELAQSISGAVR
jgi:small GTP-binding protein